MTIRYDGSILLFYNFFGAKRPLPRLKNDFSNVKKKNIIKLNELPLKNIK